MKLSMQLGFKMVADYNHQAMEHNL